MLEAIQIVKNSIFGVVVVIWGLSLIFIDNLINEATLHLLFITFTEPELGLFFIFCGMTHIIAKFSENRYFNGVANILLASIFCMLMLTHLYNGIFVIAWIGFAGISLNLVLNAIIKFRGL